MPAAFPAALVADLGMAPGAGWPVMLAYGALFIALQSLVSIILAAGEEIGWRGFWLLHLYRRYGFTGASLISGLVWGMWHVPLIVFASSSSAPLWWSLLWFMVLITAISFVYAWFRLRSRSLWPAVLLHAAHNAWLTDVFAPMTEKSPATDWVASETGVIVALAGIATGLWFWTLRGRLNAGERA